MLSPPQSVKAAGCDSHMLMRGSHGNPALNLCCSGHATQHIDGMQVHCFSIKQTLICKLYMYTGSAGTPLLINMRSHIDQQHQVLLSPIALKPQFCNIVRFDSLLHINHIYSDHDGSTQTLKTVKAVTAYQ